MLRLQGPRPGRCGSSQTQEVDSDSSDSDMMEEEPPLGVSRGASSRSSLTAS